MCATVGTQNWVYNITGSEVMSLYKPWYYEDSEYGTQQAGYLTQFSNKLSFATVHHAGHEVPGYQPESAYQLFKMYLDDSIFYSTSTSEGTSVKHIVFPDLLTEVIAIILIIVGGIGLIFGCFEYYRSEQRKKTTTDTTQEDL